MPKSSQRELADMIEQLAKEILAKQRTGGNYIYANADVLKELAKNAKFPIITVRSSVG